MFEETPAHKAIFDQVRAADRNIIISAVAGAGKSTSLVKALECIPSNKDVLFLAFNKKIAEELKGRVPAHVQCMTLNALGHRAYCGWRAPSKVVLDTDKIKQGNKACIAPQDLWSYGPVVTRLVRFAKSMGLIPSGTPDCGAGIVQDTPETWESMIEHFDVQMPEGVDQRVAIQLARQVLQYGLTRLDTIDFDDQLLMTFAYRVPMRKYDWVACDEVQDLSPLQHELVAMSLKPEGQLIAVGDENQSLYGFRGADSESMSNLQKRFDCVKLPLHVSYRCPQNVVKLAQQYVSHIQPHASAPEGTVELTGKDFRDLEYQPGEMVACRTNAPLVKVAYHLLRRRVPCTILGREIGQGLVTLIRKFKCRDLKGLFEKLSAWEDRESQKFLAQDKEEQAAAVHDKAETIRVFCEGIETIEDLIRSIETMFSEKSDGSVVVLGTIHKLKGLESHRVTILNFEDMPCRWAKKPWQVQQEVNCLYVAVTRSKGYLRTACVPRDLK